MSSITGTAAATQPSARTGAVPPLVRRIVNVVRLHAANPWTTIITPWMIFAVVFGLNVAVWYAVVVAAGGRDKLDPGAFSSNGGGTWILIFLMVAAIQAMNLTFRFALGMGFTRRDYYIGTLLYFALLAAMFASGITLMAIIERATNGWGVDGRFFMPWEAAATSAPTLWLVILLAALVFIAVGIAAATMWVRWGAVGLYMFFGAFAVVTVGTVWLVTWAKAWDDVGDYLTGHSPLTIVSWTVPITVVSAAFGYLMLRRATPKA